MEKQTINQRSSTFGGRPSGLDSATAMDLDLQPAGNAMALDELSATEGSWFNQPGTETAQGNSSWWDSLFSAGRSWWDSMTGTATSEQATIATPTVEAPATAGAQTTVDAPAPETAQSEEAAPATEAPKKDGPYTSKYGQASSDERLQVDRGQLTFDAEGTEGGRYHTRTAHWPGGVSGVTIGRGYDLGQQSKGDIERDMTAAGISAGDAAKFTPAAGKTGDAARDWLKDNKAGLPEISLEQQEALFNIVYGRLAGDVERISDNYARIVSEREGGKKEDYEVDWEKLHPAIRDLVVDLRYRGDYTPTTRKTVQPLVIANDLAGLAKVMADRSLWSNVPQDRFDRRAAYMAEAVETGAPRTDLAGTAPKEGETTTTAADPTDVAQNENAVDVTNAGQTYTVTTASLNVRSEPDTTKDNKLGKLSQGAKITATGQANGWIQFKYDGKTAWVSSSFVKLVSKEEGEDKKNAAATGDYVLSGSNWYGIANENGWKNSTNFDDLDSTFGSNCKKFVEGLRANGATVNLTAGLRHKKRAYLMHYAWHVSKGTKTAAAANEACRAEGINIEWDHGSLTQTKAAAAALVSAFGLVHAASLTSNHMSGEAMDMKISNVPSSLTIDGQQYTAGPKGNGVQDEDKVDHIGKAMGVIWFGSADWVHWSKTGR